jgi:hypothetical protein
MSKKGFTWRKGKAEHHPTWNRWESHQANGPERSGKAQINIDKAEELYREIRVENTLKFLNIGAGASASVQWLVHRGQLQIGHVGYETNRQQNHVPEDFTPWHAAPTATAFGSRKGKSIQQSHLLGEHG